MNINGYETKTTFWQDFSIAEKFGASAITDTYKRAFKEWKNNTEYVTELVMVLNWKCWHYSGKNPVYCNLYSDLFYKAQNWCYDNLKGEAFDYFWRTTN